MKVWFDKHRFDLEPRLFIISMVLLIFSCILGLIGDIIRESTDIYFAAIVLVRFIILFVSIVCGAASWIISRYNTNHPQRKEVYTHNIAAEVCDIFENFLHKRNITIPDDDRTGDETEAHIYGMSYDELLNNIEAKMVKVLIEHGTNLKLIVGVFE